MSIFSPTRNIPTELALPRTLMIVATGALVLVGLIMIYSASSIEAIGNGLASYHYLVRQAGLVVLGVAALFVLWKVLPFQLWQTKVVLIFWIACTALLVLTAILGYTALGAKRWVTIFGFRFQPSEFAKIAIVLMMARIIHQYREGELDNKRFVGAAFLYIGLPLFLIFFAQSDLGTTMICVVGIIAVLWIGEVPLRIVLVVIAVCLGLALMAVVLTGYRADRLSVFLDPWNDGAGGAGDGYQLVHSYYAFAEGGLFGVGIGNSAEKYQYLPEAETDFIFAILGEELGLVGALAVIIVFLLFLWAGLRIATSAATPVSGMVAGGLTVMIVFQAFLNISCVVGLLPTTGKPLPFISYGGSSIIATLMMVGFILSVSDEAAGANIFGQRRADNIEVIRGGR